MTTHRHPGHVADLPQSPTGSATVVLDRDRASQLARLLRQTEQFFDDCDDTVGDAVNAHYGIEPGAETISVLLSFHADDLEAALGNHETANPS
ncbi:hypothetical protein ACIQ9J_17965 [Streptomyces sp. NPDC094153]|uniref:hypothetical protein n=1 Tax=Streptomyces sp. NPDC094153 TaxID=3366058 RepID=UPI0038268A39